MCIRATLGNYSLSRFKLIADGVTVERVKLWVKKGSTIVKMEPILVTDDIEDPPLE